jgi:hypothetical protein
MSRFEWTTIGLQLLTLGFASYFAFVQNQINNRQAAITDYVSVSVIPDNGGVRFLNTGATNVYLDSITIDGEEIIYDQARQIAAKAGEASTYFAPIKFETANKTDFSIVLELTDEFGTRWTSRHAGAAADEDPQTGLFNVWTYRTSRAP